MEHAQRTLKQVQFLLDHNRLLIREINVNHESRIPESLRRNVQLICQLNSNIKKAVELYADLSSSYALGNGKIDDELDAADAIEAAVALEQRIKRQRSS